ncbi:MAG TPA: hypothetical protein VG873_14720 [Burkholderiales bacterium]|nr:hypothetical protein [Burkholderiales bacterium]
MPRPLPLAAAFLAVSFSAAFHASAQPRLQSAEECGVAADMAIVARSLAEEEVQAPKAATIMARIYDVAASERGATLMRDILDAAYKKEPGVSSRTFAEDLFATCLKTGGDLELVLGRRL